MNCTHTNQTENQGANLCPFGGQVPSTRYNLGRKAERLISHKEHGDYNFRLARAHHCKKTHSGV